MRYYPFVGCMHYTYSQQYSYYSLAYGLIVSTYTVPLIRSATATAPIKLLY